MPRTGGVRTTSSGSTATLALAASAFAPGLDARFFHPSLGHRDCLERLRYAIRPGGLAIVTGEAGIGKTLLFDVLRDSFPEPYSLITIDSPGAAHTDVQLLRALLAGAESEPRGRTGLELGADLQRLAIDRYRQGNPLRIAIDDAHQLTGSQLEIVRSLLVFTSPAAGALGVFLFGEPELVEKVDRKQRLANLVALRHALNPLNRNDTADLIAHRIGQVLPAMEHQLFSGEALDSIYDRSQGVPASIGALAAACLATAASLRHDTVDATIALTVGFRPGQQEIQVRLPLEPLETAQGFGG